MDRKRAKAELEHIYGLVSPDKQLALDVAFAALDEDPATNYSKGYYEALENGIKKKFIQLERLVFQCGLDGEKVLCGEPIYVNADHISFVCQFDKHEYSKIFIGQTEIAIAETFDEVCQKMAGVVE